MFFFLNQQNKASEVNHAELTSDTIPTDEDLVPPSMCSPNLKAFSVYNSWTRFVIFTLGYPHLLKGAERC